MKAHRGPIPSARPFPCDGRQHCIVLNPSDHGGRCRPNLAVVAVLLVLLLGPLNAGAQDGPAEKRTVPFQIGERLCYSLKWGFLPVGVAVFEVLDGSTVTGIPSYLFRLTVRSHPVIDLIYKVRDHIESYADRSMTHSLLYRKKQQEGRHRRDIEVRFDWKRSRAYRYNKGRYETRVDVPPGTFDPLGVFYAFRLNPVAVGLVVNTPVTDGKKAVMGTAAVVRREKVSLQGKTYDTCLIEPDLRHVGGVFEKSKDAKLQVWVTTDADRIVVKVKSKVVVGHFTGELTSVSGLASSQPLRARVPVPHTVVYNQPFEQAPARRSEMSALHTLAGSGANG